MKCRSNMTQRQFPIKTKRNSKHVTVGPNYGSVSWGPHITPVTSMCCLDNNNYLFIRWFALVGIPIHKWWWQLWLLKADNDRHFEGEICFTSWPTFVTQWCQIKGAGTVWLPVSKHGPRARSYKHQPWRWYPTCYGRLITNHYWPLIMRQQVLQTSN